MSFNSSDTINIIRIFFNVIEKLNNFGILEISIKNKTVFLEPEIFVDSFATFRVEHMNPNDDTAELVAKINGIEFRTVVKKDQ